MDQSVNALLEKDSRAILSEKANKIHQKQQEYALPDPIKVSSNTVEKAIQLHDAID